MGQPSAAHSKEKGPLKAHVNAPVRPLSFGRHEPIEAYFLAIAALTSSVSSETRWLSAASASVWPLL